MGITLPSPNGLMLNPDKSTGYTDPSHAKGRFSLLHEWQFRSGLDRYIWIIGMIYAYYHPTVEKWMEKLEESEFRRRISIKLAVVFVSLTYEISEFVIPFQMAWEDYIEDLNHADPYLAKIIHYVVERVLICLLLAYLQISYRLFELTKTLKTASVPSKDDKRLMHNIVVQAMENIFRKTERLPSTCCTSGICMMDRTMVAAFFAEGAHNQDLVQVHKRSLDPRPYKRCRFERKTGRKRRQRLLFEFHIC
ncbi:hypothetical protein C5167_040742 [Papaver somniferum]|uniref:Uncharacterized protein n=1 Tax=Papaver somniferum TaxID=3469 RepID=A0A4Y7IK13_PAPSO|nr:hypothetical protein C5167_040742 [Papaver somniferum]